VKFIGGRAFELGHEVEVEIPGLGRLGMNQQTPASDLGTELRGPTDGIGQETGAEPLTLTSIVQTQTRPPEGDRPTNEFPCFAGHVPWVVSPQRDKSRTNDGHL